MYENEKKCRIKVVYFNNVDWRIINWLHFVGAKQLSERCVS